MFTNYFTDLEIARMHQEEILREVEQNHLAKKAKQGLRANKENKEPRKLKKISLKSQAKI